MNYLALDLSSCDRFSTLYCLQAGDHVFLPFVRCHAFIIDVNSREWKQGNKNLHVRSSVSLGVRNRISQMDHDDFKDLEPRVISLFCVSHDFAQLSHLINLFVSKSAPIEFRFLSSKLASHVLVLECWIGTVLSHKIPFFFLLILVEDIFYSPLFDCLYAIPKISFH